MMDVTRRDFLAASAAAALGSAGGSIARAAEPATSTANAAAFPGAPAPIGDDRFGINLHLERFPRPLMLKQLALARAMSVHWVRGVFASWHIVEPRPGEVTFERVDEQMQAVLDMGMRAMGSFFYTVQWATPTSPNHAHGHGESMYPPADLGLWRKHVSRVVNRYKDHIKHWSPWNEPDNFGFFYRGAPKELWQDPQWLLQRRVKYLALQKAAYEAAKEADPSCVVLSGAFANGGQYDREFLPWLADHGLFDCCDAFDIHSYWSVRHAEQAVGVARDLMRRAGVDKPVWVTEIGAALREEKNWIGEFSHTMQLAYAPKVLATVLAQNVERTFWYEGYTPANQPRTLDESGYSVSVTDGPVPVFWSLSAMILLLRGAKLLGPASFEAQEGEVISHLFDTPTGQIVVLWAAHPERLDNRSARAQGILRWRDAEIPLELSERPTVLKA